MEIIKNGAREASSGSPDYFTGAVRIDPVHSAPEPARIRAVIVTFDPAARTAWHTHPLGQTLHVLSGHGLVQSWGGPILEIHPGDTVWFAPEEKHWHGATPGQAMTHLAMQEAQDGSVVSWMEKVSDAQYQAARDGSGA